MLYHGTSSRFLKNIEKNGLKPRGNQNSNWSEASNKEFVYLTDMYPMLFAAQALEEKNKKEKLVILEINFLKLNCSNLYPDDDFIYYGMKQKDKKNSITLEQAGSLIQYNQKLWESSLEMFGCVAHKGTISKDCISQIAEIDFRSMDTGVKMWFFGLADVSVVPEAISYRKPVFQKSIEFIFGYNDDPFELEEYKKELFGEEMKRTIKKLIEEREKHIIVRKLK